MVGHLTIRVHDPVESGTDMAKYCQPVFSIILISIDVFAPVSARGDMIQGARKF